MRFALQIVLVLGAFAGCLYLQGTEWGTSHPWIWLCIGTLGIFFYCLYKVLEGYRVVSFKPGRASLKGAVGRMVQEFEAAGFKAGDGLRTTALGGSDVVPLVNSEEKTTAAIYMIDGGGVTWEIFSHGQAKQEHYTVSTTRSELFGLLPRPTSDMVQIFPGISPTEGIEKHREARLYAEQKGVKLTPVNLLDFGRDCERLSMRRAKYAKDNILLMTCRSLWRSIKRDNPNAVPIAERGVL